MPRLGCVGAPLDTTPLPSEHGFILTSLLVAATGGHLAELHHLAARLPTDERVWVTFDTPQSRSMLINEADVLFAPYSSTRDLVGTARDALYARSLFKTRRFDCAVSTGAAIAVAFLPLASHYEIPSHYIESATRLVGPSVTGKLLQPFRSVHLYTQHPQWADRRWTYAGSIFDDFTAKEVPEKKVRKVVVSVGMHKKYGFRRLLERLAQVIPGEVDVLWQVGYTDVTGLGLDGVVSVPQPALSEAMREADVVISHAGVGSALQAFECGRRPILIPRSFAHGEHVDDHQRVLASELEDLGLAAKCDASTIDYADIIAAASWEVEANASSKPFVLRG